MKKDGYYSSGEFAKMADVTLRTIRYYDRQNLLKPSYVNEHGARFYTDSDFVKLQQILLFKFLGFSLSEIRDMTLNHPDRHVLLDSLDIQLKLVKDRREQLQLMEQTIQTTADTGRTLLLLKDSYANCFVQFLTPYYDRILMIDPRYFYDDLGALLRRERVTDALILYNYNTFVQDHALSVVLQSALFDEGE